MSDLLISIAALALIVCLGTAGLAMTGERGKFPKRMQGGGSHGANDTEQVEKDG